MRLPGRRRFPPSIRQLRRWRRVSWPTVVLIVAGALLLRERLITTPRATGDRERYHNQSFPVVRVVDGDTMDIDIPDLTTGKKTTRLRLWGVDTPEIAHGGTSDMHFGPEATEFAKKTLLGHNVHLVLSPEKTRGKYGRLLVYVYDERGGTMFNETLVRQGLAYADARFPHPYKRAFMDIEKRARRQQRGLWATVQLEQMPKWRQRFESRDAP
ncbi:MAG: thermonuclease family protein [Phycisphaerae bacterium]